MHIAEINTQARAKMRERTGFKLRDRLLARPDVIGRLSTPVAPLVNLTLRNGAAAGARREARRARTAAPRCRPIPAARSSAGRKKHTSPPAARARRLLPRLRRELVRAATAARRPSSCSSGLGCQVDVPKRPAVLRAAGAVQRHVRPRAQVHAPDGAARWRRRRAAGVDIVGTSTSCTLMLKREAREILGLEDDADLRAVSDRIYDICEYLLMLHDRGELRTDFQPLPITVTYHAPCQQQGHGIGKPALDLMALVPELRVIENDAVCCGVAGTYGLKAEKFEIAMDVGARLFDQIADARPDLAVCDSETCRWHIEEATGVQDGAPDRDPAPRRRPVACGRPRHRLPQRDAGGRRGRARAADGRRGRGDRGGRRDGRPAGRDRDRHARSCWRRSSARRRPTA